MKEENTIFTEQEANYCRLCGSQLIEQSFRHPETDEETTVFACPNDECGVI